jgi:phosphoglycerate kinase
MKKIQESKDLKGKKVLLRSTLNVPIKNEKIINDFRLRASLKTINFLRDSGAKVILIGHIGRGPESLLPVFEYFKTQIPTISFTQEVLGEKTNSAIEQMNDGDIVMLENLRVDDREVVNDDSFAKELAGLADFYVNDAFSVSHREHASVVGVPKYLESFIGILFQEEMDELSEAINPPAGSLCILGGAKFNTKEPIIKKMISKYDKIFVFGALANDLFKARGFNIGVSLSSDVGIDVKELVQNEKIIIPSDVTVENKEGIFVKKPNEVLAGDNIVDAGPETIEGLSKIINDAKFILWNGPLGEYERGFGKHTELVAQVIANSPAKTLIGGGDTIASTEHLGLDDKFSFISTAGGAMLKFLLDGTLVGIEVLRD